MDYSRITITFLIDLPQSSTLRLTTSLGGNNTNHDWVFVATRSAAFEITTGTPTANAGETSAINFDAAYTIDLPIASTTTRTVNALEIVTQTEGLDFIGFQAAKGNTPYVQGIHYLIAFNNYVEPIDLIDIDNILVRSPHYVNTPFNFDTTTSATIDVFIWNGDYTVVPATPSITLTKIRPTIDYSEFNTNISDLIKSSLDSQLELPVIASTGNIENANDNEFKWVKYVASYTDPYQTIANVQGVFGSGNGYGYFRTGVNPSLFTLQESRYLTSLINRNVAEDGLILLPFVNDDFYSNISAISIGGGNISINQTLTSTDESTDYIKYVMIDVSDALPDDRVRINFTLTSSPLIKNTIIYNIIKQCEQQPKTIVFRNRFGYFDTVTMFAKTVEKLTVKKSKFVNNYVQNGTYDIEKHQIKDINIIGNESFSVASGFIRESENVLIKELLLSDTVYLWDSVDKNLNPIRVKTSNITYKNRLNDQKVQYTIDFDFAYNTINNI